METTIKDNESKGYGIASTIYTRLKITSAKKMIISENIVFEAKFKNLRHNSQFYFFYLFSSSILQIFLLSSRF